MTCAQTSGGLVVDKKTIRGAGAVTLVGSIFFVGDGAAAAPVVARAELGVGVLVGAASDGENPGNEVVGDKIGFAAGATGLRSVLVGRIPGPAQAARDTSAMGRDNNWKIVFIPFSTSFSGLPKLRQYTMVSQYLVHVGFGLFSQMSLPGANSRR